MYTRTYSDESSIVIPERYGGTSFTSTKDDSYESTQNECCKDEGVHTEYDEEKDEAIQTTSFATRLPFGGLLSNILKKDFFSLQNFGKEEILIIAAAAFLLFSKEGDKECAIMLLLLLFFK